MILSAIAAKLKRRSKDEFKGRHFEAGLIVQAVSWYLRYPLSYRDIEELLLERGLEVDHSTVIRWVLAYAPLLERRLRPFRNAHCGSIRVDETYIRVHHASRLSYDAVLGTIDVGGAVVDVLPTGQSRLFYRHGGISFIVTEPLNGEPAIIANGGTIAFRCGIPEQVQHLHDVAVAHVGVSVEDAPGLRQNPIVGGIFAAYVRDPDGNKLCATHRIAPHG